MFFISIISVYQILKIFATKLDFFRENTHTKKRRMHDLGIITAESIFILEMQYTY